MKRILILANSDEGLYDFRRELLEKLIELKYIVYVSVPNGKRRQDLKEIGVEIIDTNVDRRGINIFKDLKLMRKYNQIIKKIKPNVVLTYTIKPNIYGGMICRKTKTPYIANITGLGSAVEKNSLLSKILIKLYRVSFKNIKCVFCQNISNLRFLESKKIANGKLRLIPGSGVNLNRFKYIEYPTNKNIQFLFVGRIMKEKGIEQYCETAKEITSKYKNVKFKIIGRCEENYLDYLKKLQSNGCIEYCGEQKNVIPFLRESNCIINPTFYPEGMSNVLLEASASGRPVITTNRPGCKEIVKNNITGYLIKERNVKDLIEKVEKFLNISIEQRKQMGIEARKKVEKEFDRNIVIKEYLKEIDEIHNGL